MAEAKIGGALPKGEGDGLSGYAGEMIRDPHRFRVVLAVIDVKKLTTDFDSGDTIPVARIRRIEMIAGPDLATAEQLMRRAQEKRSDMTVLPLDLEDEISSAFRDIDTSTGEIRGE